MAMIPNMACCYAFLVGRRPAGTARPLRGAKRHMNLQTLRLALRVLIVSVVLAAQVYAEDEAPSPSVQLEAGKGVKLIDMGATKMEDLNDAFKKLNAPPPPPPEPEKPGDDTASQPDNAEGEGEAPALAETKGETGAEGVANADHPAWLIAKWTTDGKCSGGSVGAPRIIAFTVREANFAQQHCAITALSAPQADELVAIYRCKLNGKTTQESHVFKKIDDQRMLLDNVDELKRCE
jgi:hypothetical protein